MNQIPRAVASKVPGQLTKMKSEKYVADLSTLDRVKLLEIKEREEKLLANKAQIARLPDKGKRIKDFYEKVLKELEQRDDVAKAVEMFSDLNLASSGQGKLANLEWTGKCVNGEAEVLDSDDEDVDPLAVIAQSAAKTKIVVKQAPEPSLITPADLEEIKSFSSEMDPHALYLVSKSVDGRPKTEQFKPYKTTKTDVHDPLKEKLHKQHRHWENTAATPPPIQHAGTKMLSLSDSVEIQAEYLNNLKEMQEKQAEVRLAARKARALNMTLPDEQIRKVSQFFKSYREIEEEIEEIEVHEHSAIEGRHASDDEEGVRDDEDDKGAGVINFTVYN